MAERRTRSSYESQLYHLYTQNNNTSISHRLVAHSLYNTRDVVSSKHSISTCSDMQNRIRDKFVLHIMASQAYIIMSCDLSFPITWPFLSPMVLQETKFNIIPFYKLESTQKLSATLCFSFSSLRKPQEQKIVDIHLPHSTK